MEAETIEYRKDWGTSEAKAQLKEDILCGRIDDWKPMRVYNDPERHDRFYRYYKYENFSANLRELRKAVGKGLGHAERDQNAFDNYKVDNPPPLGGRPRWHRSEAQKLCRQLVQTNEIAGMKPSEVRELSPLFMVCTKKEFRDHFNHEKSRHWKKMHDEEYAMRVRFLKSTIDTI